MARLSKFDLDSAPPDVKPVFEGMLAKRGDDSKVSEKEAAAIRWAEQVTVQSLRIPDAEFEKLKSFYTEGEIVELTAAVGLFNYFNRFNNALHMEVTV